MFQKQKIIGKNKALFNLANFPFYYGWIILFIGSIGVLASVPGQTMGVSVFTDYYISNLNISRVEISTAYMIGTLGSSLLISYAGIFFDRYGARIVAAIATIFLGLFLLIFGFSPEIILFLTNIFNVSRFVIVFTVITIGFFGIRFFGQGVLTLVSKGMVAKWFGPRRGFAVGIMGLITAFGFSFAPQPLNSMINKLGWTKSLITIALVLLVIFLPLVLIFYRAEPNKYGIEVEQGMKNKNLENKNRVKDAKVQKTVAEAKREPLYWIIVFSLGFWSLFNTAFTFHVVSIFDEIGVSADQAVKIFFPISIISVCSRFLGSYFSDRIQIKYIYIGYIFSLILSSFSILLISFPIGKILVIISFGIGGGLYGMLNIVTWPKLYGRKHYGAISGFSMSIAVASSAVGPWLFSLANKFTNSYKITGFVGIIISTIFLILVFKSNWNVVSEK
ncbi:MAG: MFS transporter [Sphaerochaetaceae bacterium]